MNEHIGKLPPNRTAALLKDAYGAPSDKIIVGPGAGLDAAIIDIGSNRVMAIAEDPIFPAAGLPLEIMGTFTVHIGASDVAVTGVKPSMMTYSLLLPPGFSEEETRKIIVSISETANQLGIAIAGGHTGWYGAVTIPIIGGVTVWGYADKDDWISPGGAKDGDVLLMSKGPSIEASALLAIIYKDKLSGKISSSHLDSLCARTDQITVVQDALSAYKAGGVHAMHDATEGGVLGGLYEMSAACGINIYADFDAVPVPDDITAFANALNFDPWAAISEGTLLAAVDPKSVDGVLNAWKEYGIEGFVLGRFDSTLKSSIIHRNNCDSELEEPGVDPFWNLFLNA